MSRAERETVIRWDCEDRRPVMYTANPAQARRWTRLGYAVRVVDTARDGTPRGLVRGGPGRLRPVQAGHGRGHRETGQRRPKPLGTLSGSRLKAAGATAATRAEQRRLGANGDDIRRPTPTGDGDMPTTSRTPRRRLSHATANSHSCQWDATGMASGGRRRL